jgi:uncharacterized lipoprotein NlpE involved in copper resistance
MQDDKTYHDLDDAVIYTDCETGDEYTLNANGTRNYLAEF